MSTTATRKNFSLIVQKLRETQNWHRFDEFLIRFLGYEWEGTDGPGDEMRKKAYRLFLQRTEDERCATLPTIRRWFGIGEFHSPNRAQIYGICISLRLSLPETERFLKEGILEPSFQISDYSEIIAMYVLENRLGMKKYESMLSEYEEKMAGYESGSPRTEARGTEWLFRQFENIKIFPEREFLAWMWEHMESFKGYSRTLQGYLEHYRKRMVEQSQQEIRRQLHILLSETRYYSWRDEHGRKSVDEKKEIKRYLSADSRRKKPTVSPELRKNISELVNIAYTNRAYNTYIVSELFEMWERAGMERQGILPRETVKFMSGKHVSDLFNIPVRNRLAQQTHRALFRLRQMDSGAAPPKEIVSLAEECGGGEPETVEEAVGCLERFEKENKRRRLIVQRGDLLPLILYVAQQTFLQETRQSGAPYDGERARKVFTTLADETLIACGMEPLNEKYLLDAVLLACFQKNEMYTYTDVLALV